MWVYNSGALKKTPTGRQTKTGQINSMVSIAWYVPLSILHFILVKK